MGNFNLAEMSLPDIIDELLDFKFSIIVGFVSFVFVIRMIINSFSETYALNPAEWTNVKLAEKIYITHNTRVFRFSFDNPGISLGLPIGKHIVLKAEIGDTEVMQPYVPVTDDSEKGFFDLVIKIYEHGRMTSYLDGMAVGDSIAIRGPRGALTYKGDSHFGITHRDGQEEEIAASKVGLIAGGTGITPCLQFIRAVLRNPMDQTRMSLVFGNTTEDDIIMRDELEAFAAAHSNFDLYFTVDKPSEGWNQGRGFITADMIRARMPPPGPDTLVLLCGPPPMMELVSKLLAMMGYSKEMIYKF